MKLTITRVLETARYLATEPGQALEGFIGYMAEFVDQTVRALRNGLTFADNFDCQVRTVSLRHQIPQIVSSERKVTGMIPIRLVEQGLMLRDFGWYYDDNGRLTVEAAFDSDPGKAIDVQLVMLF